MSCLLASTTSIAPCSSSSCNNRVNYCTLPECLLWFHFNSHRTCQHLKTLLYNYAVSNVEIIQHQMRLVDDSKWQACNDPEGDYGLLHSTVLAFTWRMKSRKISKWNGQ
jgi:hypothetical protein